MTPRERRSIARSEERLFPPARRPTDGMLGEHRARYSFAAGSLRGRVLDLGCGTGYGCHDLCGHAPITEVMGIDRSPEAIAWAERYYSNPRVSYRVADLEAAGWETGLGVFDRIVAFEVLEHLSNEEPLWRGIRRLLSPDGALWLSTPLGRGRGIPPSDPYHLHQLTRCDVARLFSSGWKASYYGQTGTWIEAWTPGRRYYTILVRAALER